MPCARSARSLLIERLTSLAFKIVEDIAATLRVRREDLNIVASPKGLFAGCVQIITKDGKVVEPGENERIFS
jgi:DNA topoisomerase VI subunit A